MLSDIYILLAVALVFWYFIYLRKIAEMGKRHAAGYCKQNNLQLLAIARRSSRLRFNQKNGLHWSSIFDFEFSGDGESHYQGVLTLKGLKLEDVVLPAYRV